jgi:hypothetical protein
MRAGLVVSSVLGLGSALTFAAALLVASLFPNGTLVGGQGAVFTGGGVRLGGPLVITRSSTTDFAVSPPLVDTTAPADGSAPSTPEASPAG